MSHDHYIAVTYLKHFGDPAEGGKLHAYRKRDGFEFDCAPQTVCREWKGDQNPEFFRATPNVLGEYRKMFEPSWNPSVADLLARERISADTKLLLSGYIANLMMCTPAWRRVGVSIFERGMLSHMKFAKRMKLKHGGHPEVPVAAIEKIEQGRINLTANPQAIAAMTTVQLMEQAFHLYTQPWTILHNDTDQPFLTSDNPVALDTVGMPDVSHRMIAIAPRLAIHIPISLKKSIDFDVARIGQLLRTHPMGNAVNRQASIGEVKEINVAIVRCAEELVFSPKRSANISKLVKKYAKHRVYAELEEIESATEPDTILRATFILVGEK